jgi:hypothetical protein
LAQALAPCNEYKPAYTPKERPSVIHNPDL